MELNAGELYPLLACMITARTWDSVEGGIAKKQRSRQEVGLTVLLGDERIKIAHNCSRT